MNGPAVILVVDDESELTASYGRVLRRHGHEVVTAATCADALARLQGRRPALVISDIELPDGDGIAVVRAARSMQPPVPAIVITARASSRGRADALAAGAVSYLSKPIAMAALLSLVGETLAPGGDDHTGRPPAE